MHHRLWILRTWNLEGLYQTSPKQSKCTHGRFDRAKIYKYCQKWTDPNWPCEFVVFDSGSFVQMHLIDGGCDFDLVERPAPAGATIEDMRMEESQVHVYTYKLFGDFDHGKSLGSCWPFFTQKLFN